jgi:hypothetical protein
MRIAAVATVIRSDHGVAVLTTNPAGGTAQRAIRARRAFRHYRDALDEHPDVLTRFHRFADERQRGRARRWLADHGLRAVGRTYD